MPNTLEKPSLANLLLESPILKKVSTGITGLLLVLYLGQHLLANLRIFSSDPQAVSKYGFALEAFGPLLRFIEIGLAVVILYHALLGVLIWINKNRARPEGYMRYKSVGRESRQTFSSRTMIWTGLLLLAFLVFHVAWFRFGPGIADGYATSINGHDARHYERLVTERFQNIGIVIFYIISMLAVGFHLSHGVWSALQSLGLVNNRNQDSLYKLGVFIGAAVSLGFISIPLYIYFG